MRELFLVWLILGGTAFAQVPKNNFKSGRIGGANVEVKAVCRNGYWYDVWVGKSYVSHSYDSAGVGVGLFVTPIPNDQGKHKRCYLRKNQKNMVK